MFIDGVLMQQKRQPRTLKLFFLCLIILHYEALKPLRVITPTPTLPTARCLIVLENI